MVEAEIKSAVRQAIEKAKNELKFKYNGSNLVNEEDVKSIIKTKIDRNEVLSYLETKSNVHDAKITMDSIEILQKQLKHLCVITIEIIRQEVGKYTSWKDTVLTKQNKWLTILYQSISIAKWINNFKNFDNLQEFQKVVTSTLDDISDLAISGKNDYDHK